MQLASEEQILYLKIALYLAYSRFLLKTTSFKTIAAKLGVPMTETSTEINEADRKFVQRLGKMIRNTSLYTPFRSMCFEQALTLKFILNRRGIQSTIYLGVTKDENALIKAHAWTRSGGVFPTGNKEKEHYTVISTFGVKQQL